MIKQGETYLIGTDGKRLEKMLAGLQDDDIFPPNSVYPEEDAKTEDGCLMAQANRAPRAR